MRYVRSPESRPFKLVLQPVVRVLARKNFFGGPTLTRTTSPDTFLILDSNVPIFGLEFQFKGEF